MCQIDQNIAMSFNNPTIIGTLTNDHLDYVGTLNIGENSAVKNIGSLSNTDNKVINKGGLNDQVNNIGITNSIQSTNTQILNKTITLNEGKIGNSQSGSCG